MLKKIIDRLLRHRHPWRKISFDELSEIYTSMLFRSLAVSLVGIFIPFYLYQEGVSIAGVFLFYAAMFFVWQLTSIVSAFFVARYGPKHTILTSHVFVLLAMLMLTTLGQFGWPIYLIAFCFGVGNSLFYLALRVDFSKVNHDLNAGKEIGWLFILAKAGQVLGPAAGGLVAALIGPQFIFIAAIAVMLLGSLPLFFTPEPVRTHQSISFRDLDLKEAGRDLAVSAPFGIDRVILVTVWPFFIALFVFVDNPYLGVGMVTSFGVLIALFAARTIGSLIDKKRGRLLLRSGAVLNSLLYLARPFVGSLGGVLSVNVASEVTTPMYRMAYIRGIFDSASSLPGRRIVYLASVEYMTAAASAIVMLLAAAVSVLVEPRVLFALIFILGAWASLMLTVERFKALDR